MRPLDDAWDELAARLAKAPAVVVGSDFDGTLVPIQDRPEAVELSPEPQETLARLASLPGLLVAVVSGRALKDAERRAGVLGAVVIGSYGFEARFPDGTIRRAYGPQDVETVRWAAREAASLLRDVPGVFFEDKGPVIALHYRQALPEDVRRIAAAVSAAGARHASSVRVTTGKCILEFRPDRAMDKGIALIEVAAAIHPPEDTMYWYFGDDATDEDVFRRFQGRGLTVKVGPGRTVAACRVAGPAAVRRLLGRLLLA